MFAKIKKELDDIYKVISSGYNLDSEDRHGSLK